jgi:DNA-binding SARP family transcriptional activator/Tfp pilus assembly protein PilF
VRVHGGSCLRFEILGPLRVVAGGTSLVLNGRREQTILGTLLLHADRLVPVSRLVSAVWDGSPPATAATQVRNRISVLRRLLATVVEQPDGLLVTEGDGYRLRLQGHELDLARFEYTVSVARAAAGAGERAGAVRLLREALGYWRGQALAGLNGAVVDAARTGLEERRLAVTEECLGLELALGRHSGLVAELSGLVETYPFRETLIQYLMLALYRSGRQADALACYQAHVRALREELGLDPSSQVRALHEAILRRSDAVEALAPQAVGDRAAWVEPAAAVGQAADVGPVLSRPAGLPADLIDFAGRGSEIAQLDALLREAQASAAGGVRIVAMSGTGGVGKTTLAVHWAHQVAGRFPDGQLYLNLRGFDPAGRATTPAEAVRSFLDALDVPAQRVPAGLDAQTALYRGLLAERRMLILLDNARDAEQVRPLLPGTPGCFVLVTSRNQLTGLIVDAGALPLPLDLLDSDEAGELLARRLGTDRVEAESAAVAEIIERCARLPLALAIAAARAALQPGLPLAVLADELGQLRDRLDGLATGDTGTDVRSVFSWSYEQLSAPAARLFRLLGVHPGPDLSVSAAASLAGIPPARLRPILAELVRVHLVSERAGGRYALHDLLRAYAGELAASSDPAADRQAAVQRLLDHYIRCAHRAAVVLNPTRDMIGLTEPLAGVAVDDVESAAAATDWLTTEYQALMAAVALAVDAGLDRHAWQLVWSMTSFVAHRDFRDSVLLHQIALGAAERLGDLSVQAHSHRMSGRAYVLLGEYDEAHTHFARALRMYGQLGDDANQAHVRLGLAEMLERQGRYQDALHHAEQALTPLCSSGQRTGLANALNSVGWCHIRLGDYGTALNYCEQALDLLRGIGYRLGEAATWDSLGVAYHHLGRYAEAVDAYHRALALFRDHGNRYNEADTLVNLGDTYHASGDTGAARDRWQEALAILTDFGHAGAEKVVARLDRNQITGG